MHGVALTLGPADLATPLYVPCMAQLPASAVDVEILHDATRREARAGFQKDGGR